MEARKLMSPRVVLTTIIVKSAGKVAFSTSFFPSSRAPGPMLSKTLMFVCVIVLLHPNIE